MIFSKIKSTQLKTLILFFQFLIISISSISQTYTMTNGGSATTCSGTFLDPGGNGNYAGNQNSSWTYTICNPSPGQPIYVDFTMFDLWSNNCIVGQSYDELFVYNGTSTSSPLINVFSDLTANPTYVTGFSGCLTFRFKREKVGSLSLCSQNNGSPGWTASISCTPPPPDGTACPNAYPFCSALGYDFPNATGTSAPSGPNYGCLGSQPNPVWYYMKVDQSGSFQIALSQTTGTGGSGAALDVDFALYGPFTSLDNGCNNVMGGTSAPIQCSYSPSNTETIGIGLPGGIGSGASTPPSAVAGQFYILLMTNYAASNGYIAFNQSGGTGLADCSIVSPCDITAITATPSACNTSNNTYNVTGNITFVDPPTVGTLTITSDCGGTQVFNAPFISPLSYSLNGLPSNSASCTVTAVFSDDVSCTNTQTFTAPAACVTPCTITASSSLNSVCPGVAIDLSATTVVGATYAWNGPSGFVSADQNPIGVTPPTAAGTYTYTVVATTSSTNCTSIVSVTVNALPLVSPGTYGPVCLDAAPISLVGTPAGGTFSGTGVSANSFDPSVGTQTVNYSLTDVNGCSYSENVTITVNPLPVVSAGVYASMCSSDADLTLVGTPAGGVFSGTGVTGNNFDPSVGTQTITYTFSDGNNCVNSATSLITVVTPLVDAGTYPAVCSSVASVNLVGSPAGGTFSGTGVSGNTFNTSSGTQTVTYTLTASGCTATSTALITVNPPPVVSAGNYPPVCTSVPTVALVGTPAGGAFSGTGVTGSVFNTSSGTQTVTYNYTDGNGCSNSATSVITVNPLPIVNAGTYTPVCADASPIALAGTPAGGTFSGTGVTANSFNPASGTQTITYSFTNANGCTNTANSLITINPLPAISAGVDQTVCSGTSMSLSGAGGATYLWNNGGVDGQSFIPTLGSTTFIVTGTDANGCTNTDQAVVTVVPVPVAAITSDVNTGYGPLEVTFTNSSSNAASYLWNFGNGGTGTTTTLTDENSTYTASGDYWMVLTASNGICEDKDSVFIIVLPIPPSTVTVPNVFTPNGDGLNDLFFLETTNIKTLKVIIFNRWGEVMHEINAPAEYWNGMTKSGMASEGVYFYKYTAEGFDGQHFEDHGNVTLVNQK